MTYVVRTSGAPEASARRMRQLLTDADSSLAPQSIATMEDVVGRTIAGQRFQTRLLSIFSILALLLAAIGIYGVLASSVVERQREIGIRVALGADRASVMLIVLRRTIVLAVTGVAIGAAGAFALTRVLEKLLFNVTPTDVTTFLVSAGVLVGVALSAGLFPARRASGVDPLVALRSE
jgi:ABC-type antimicrobial peptide transport system permease subunit